MADAEDIRFRIKHGNRWPYDASDAWWKGERGDDDTRTDEVPAAILDWAHRAARAILSDMNDRRGIKLGFIDIDEDVRREIVETTAAIIREAHAQATPKKQVNEDATNRDNSRG
jgi:hypothetical protein